MVQLHSLVDEKDSSVLSVNQTMNAFEITQTEGFEDLRIRQTEIAMRVRTCVDLFDRLKDLKLDPEDPKSAEYVGQLVDFDDSRHDCISMIKAFYAASGEAILAFHKGDAKASVRRARSVVKLMEHWRSMIKSTKYLHHDEDDEEDDEEDRLWVNTPTVRNMADLISGITTEKGREVRGAEGGAVGAPGRDLTNVRDALASAMTEGALGGIKRCVQSEASKTQKEKETTPIMSRMAKVTHELRSRSVEMKELLTPKSKSKQKNQKERKGSSKEISPIRASTPTPVLMLDEEREREDKIMEKGSAGKRKKAAKKGKGPSPKNLAAEEEEETEGGRDGSEYETKGQTGGGVVALRQHGDEEEKKAPGGRMKIQIFEKDEETEKLLEELKKQQIKYEEMKRKTEEREKKLREVLTYDQLFEKRGFGKLIPENKTKGCLNGL